jgi:hypothetical protein
MALFDRISNTISAAGKDGLNRAKDIKDSAKIAMDIKEREGAIRKMYYELGKAYYQDHSGDEQPDYDQVLAIKAAFEEINELKSNKDDIRGIRRCPACGTPVSQEANFCSSCGAKCEPEPEFVDCEVVDEEAASEEEVFEEEVSEEAFAEEAEDDEEEISEEI